MSKLQEVPTDDLLSFQDFPAVHNAGANNPTLTTVNVPADHIDQYGNIKISPEAPKMQIKDEITTMPSTDEPTANTDVKSFWTLEYYQKYFDVDTKDVIDRILASITPRWDSTLKHHLRTKPDLYGPVWISLTLIFTIAVSGNIANYLQYAGEKYHWRYEFHLVSYAATTICLYISLVPLTLWGLLKYTSEKTEDLEGFQDSEVPGMLELICIYGYSLFIYIPVSILWTVQIGALQWILAISSAGISGAVLLLTLLPALRLSRYKFLLMLGILGCHLLLATGFMLCFFHSSKATPVVENVTVAHVISKNVTAKHV